MSDELIERVYDAMEKHIPNEGVQTGDVRDAAIAAISVVRAATIEECLIKANKVDAPDGSPPEYEDAFDDGVIATIKTIRALAKGDEL